MNDPAEVLKKIEEDKLKKVERAERFGIETKDVTKMKIQDRKERFKTKVYAPTDDEKQDIDARKARFGTVDEKTEKKKDFRALEFTLDDYKTKMDKKKFKKQNGFKNKDKNNHKQHKSHKGKPQKKQFSNKRKF